MNVTEESYLGGKILIRKLPEFATPPVQGGPPLKRLLLSKGELAQIHDSELAVRYIAWLELRSGQSRGHHYHKIKQEHLYLAAGSLTLRARDVGEGEQIAIPLVAGTLAQIEPGVAHVLEPLEDGFAVEFSPTHFDAQDTYPFQLAPG